MWAEYGPGAVGVGWEQGLLGLALHLRGGSVRRSERMAAVGRGARLLAPEQRGWGEANRAAGADPETVARGVANTTVFYAPDPDAVP